MGLTKGSCMELQKMSKTMSSIFFQFDYLNAPFKKLHKMAIFLL